MEENWKEIFFYVYLEHLRLNLLVYQGARVGFLCVVPVFQETSGKKKNSFSYEFVLWSGVK